MFYISALKPDSGSRQEYYLMVFLTFSFRHIGCFPVKLIPGNAYIGCKLTAYFIAQPEPQLCVSQSPAATPRFIILTVEIHLIGWLEYEPVSQ